MEPFPGHHFQGDSKAIVPGLLQHKEWSEPAAQPELPNDCDSQQDEQERSSFGEEMAGNGPSTTAPSNSRKRRHGARSDHGAGGGSSPLHSHVSGGRYDSSLGALTKKFMDLLNQMAVKQVDLNQAADMLKVQKRRIYDITNVLEGVGLLRKQGKNLVQWLGYESLSLALQQAQQESAVELQQGKAADEEMAGAAEGGVPQGVSSTVAVLQADVTELKAQEASLDEQIEAVTAALRAMGDDPANRESLFVADSDITSLPCFAADTLFAVKAPPGTTLEVPDPTDPAWSGGAGLHEGASSFGGHHTPGHGETPRVDARGSAGGAAGASALLGTQQGTHVGGRPEPGAAGVGSSQRHYRILLKSQSGPVDVYLLRAPRCPGPPQPAVDMPHPREVCELGASHMPNDGGQQLRSHGGHMAHNPSSFSHQHHSQKQAGGYQPQLQQQQQPFPHSQQRPSAQHNLLQQQCSADQNMVLHSAVTPSHVQAWAHAHQLQVQQPRHHGSVFTGAAGPPNHTAELQTPTSAGVHNNSTAGGASRSFQYVQGCTAQAHQQGAQQKPLPPTHLQQGAVQRQPSEGPPLYRPQPQRPQALHGAAQDAGDSEGGGDAPHQPPAPTPHSGRPTMHVAALQPQQQDDVLNGVAVATHLVLERSGSAHALAGPNSNAAGRQDHQQQQHPSAGARHQGGTNGGVAAAAAPGFGSMFSSPGGPGPVCGFTAGTMSPLIGLGHFANGPGPGTPAGGATFLSPGGPYMGANSHLPPGASPAYGHQQHWGGQGRSGLLPGTSPAGRHMLPGGCSVAALGGGPGGWGTIPESELDAWFRGCDLDLLGTPGGPGGGGLGLGAMFKDDPHTLMEDTRALLGPLAPAGVMG